jgi:uncharacterized membrane protein
MATVATDRYRAVTAGTVGPGIDGPREAQRMTTGSTAGSTEQAVSRSFQQRGALVLALFAVLWAAVAASGLPAALGWPVRIGAVVVAVAIIAAALRRPGAVRERVRTLPRNWRRSVGIVNGAQFAVIALVVVAGLTTGAPQIVPPLVALVVGLHFLPLARLFDQPQYTFTAAGLCLAAVLGGLVLLVGPSVAGRGSRWAASPPSRCGPPPCGSPCGDDPAPPGG